MAPSKKKKRHRILPKPSAKLAHEVDWSIGHSKGGNIHVKLTLPGQKPYHAAFSPEDAYDFAENILRIYDHVAGLGAPPPRAF
jgi:hypothetical protein